MSNYTPEKIREIYNEKQNGHFFDPGTMRFFGDAMQSYGVKVVNGNVVMYRKKSANVNVFGNIKRAGRDFFNCWKFCEETGRLETIRGEEEQKVWESIYGR